MWLFGINTPEAVTRVRGSGGGGGQGASWVSAFPSSQTNVPTWGVYSPLRCANDLAPRAKNADLSGPTLCRPAIATYTTHSTEPAHARTARTSEEDLGCKLCTGLEANL